MDTKRLWILLTVLTTACASSSTTGGMTSTVTVGQRCITLPNGDIHCVYGAVYGEEVQEIDLVNRIESYKKCRGYDCWNVICEGRTISLQCPKDFEMIVGGSFYGLQVDKDRVCHTDYPIDNSLISTLSPSCTVAESHMKIRGLCEGRQTCSITATPAAFGRDECKGEGRHVRVSYECFSFVGSFVCTKYPKDKRNGWHYVKITANGKNTYRWSNSAGASWVLHKFTMFKVTPKKLFTGAGYPYTHSTVVHFGVDNGKVYVTGPFGERYYRQ